MSEATGITTYDFLQRLNLTNQCVFQPEKITYDTMISNVFVSMCLMLTSSNIEVGMSLHLKGIDRSCTIHQLKFFDIGINLILIISLIYCIKINIVKCLFSLI